MLKAAPDKLGKNVKNTKVWSKPLISKNQVPKPYKPPSAIINSEMVQTFKSSPEYSNVKKASIVLKNTAVSAKISRFSSHDEKPTTSKKSETFDILRHPSNEVENSNSLIRKLSHTNSSTNKYEKKAENSNSLMNKSSSQNMNNSKLLLKNSFIPAKNAVFRPKVIKSSTEPLNKELKHNPMNSNGSPTKLKKQIGSVINQSKPPLVQNLQNQTSKLSETSKVKSPVATKVELQHASAVPSDKPAFIVHVERSSGKKVSVRNFLHFLNFVCCLSLKCTFCK